MSNCTQVKASSMTEFFSEHNAPDNPYELFRGWFELAKQIRKNEFDYTAMSLATATPAGKPSVRVVLLKHFDHEGFVFYTNYNSRKGDELHANPQACLMFYWPELGKQVRIEGRTAKVTAEESDQYFASRAKLSQLGAIASDQSTVIAGRDVLEKRMQELEQQYQSAHIPRPDHWGGYRVAPGTIEFWQNRDNRLHDRLVYRRKDNGDWKIERLAP